LLQNYSKQRVTLGQTCCFLSWDGFLFSPWWGMWGFLVGHRAYEWQDSSKLEEVLCELTARTAPAFAIGLVTKGRILDDVAHPPPWEFAQSRATAVRGSLWCGVGDTVGINPLYGRVLLSLLNAVKTKCWFVGYEPLQNSTLGFLVAEGSNVLRQETGLWYTEAEVWGFVPKAAWRWGVDSSVANDPFGAPGSTPASIITLMMEALRTSETSIYLNKVTRRYIPEVCRLRKIC
jgi:hypothetical protein